jgi:hypothetical protein
MDMKDVINVDHNYKSVDDCESVNSVDSVDCKMEDCRSGEDSESVEDIESVEESNVDRNRKSKKTKVRRMNKNVALKKKRITKRIHKIIDEKVC